VTLSMCVVVECTRAFSSSFAGGAVVQVPTRANTMSSVLEVLGMSLPYSSSTPALYPGVYSCGQSAKLN
jgi:dihydroxyacid dehydratase/phosphogluconate dehydratase